MISPRIEVEGEIVIGSAMKLVQSEETVEQPVPVWYGGRPTPQFGNDVEFTPPMAAPGSLPFKRLVNKLENMNASIALANDGLTCSYAILGAPGTGKTRLLVHSIEQLLALNKDNRQKRFGALILDPKAALIEDIKHVVKRAGRDLVIINTNVLHKSGEALNVIDCHLDPYELGRALVLAAQSAGVGASDPFWFMTWSNLFGAALYLLSWRATGPVTLQELMDELLLNHESKDGPSRKILELARGIEDSLNGPDVPEGKSRDAQQAISIIRSFYRERHVETVESFIIRGYGAFQRSKYDCYSVNGMLSAIQTTNLYDSIIEDGTIVLVSLSPAEPDVAKMLCTLMKCLFQQTVMGRLERYESGSLKNFERPILIACDEYGEVASEVPGQPMGDGHFFSQSRQNGCMGLLATQSVAVLHNSSLRDAWKSVFSNFAAKIFMGAADNDTVEEATKLAGQDDWQMLVRSRSRSKEGMGTNEQKEFKERQTLPHHILTRVLKRRQGVVIGSLDGRVTEPAIRFFEVPNTDKKQMKDGESS